MTVRVIDIETTGVDPAVDAIIEIASIDVRADGNMIFSKKTAGRFPTLQEILEIVRRG